MAGTPDSTDCIIIVGRFRTLEQGSPPDAQNTKLEPNRGRTCRCRPGNVSTPACIVAAYFGPSRLMNQPLRRCARANIRQLPSGGVVNNGSRHLCRPPPARQLVHVRYTGAVRWRVVIRAVDRAGSPDTVEAGGSLAQTPGARLSWQCKGDDVPTLRAV